MTDHKSDIDKAIVDEQATITDSDTISEEFVLEKPFKKLLIVFTLVLTSLVAILFVTGLILGLSGRKPPTFEIESFTKPDGKEQVVTTTTTLDTGKSTPVDTDAFEAGKEAGKDLKEHKGSEDQFWSGFNEGLKGK